MIFSVSGKMGSGKDTVGAILQYLTSSDVGPSAITRLRAGLSIGGYCTGEYEIKKFADKLKDITCMLIGCTREGLEDANFKNTELCEEWWYWKENITGKIVKPYYGKEVNDFILVKLTPRTLLQILGTECGRDIIHPNIWVNSLMNEYQIIGGKLISPEEGEEWTSKYHEYPNWIITDCRFPNELEAVKNKGGITIKVVRPHGYTNPDTGEYKEVPISYHSSEIALDDSKFDYTIYNDGTIDELIEKVRSILVI